MKTILDPSFKYVPSASTDIRKTFARARREMTKTKPVGPLVVVSLMPKDRKKA